MKAKDIDIPDDLVDEIVDEILEETKAPVEQLSTKKTKIKEESFLDSEVPDSVKLKSRIQYLENRIEKHVHDYKTTAIEVERQISDKFSEFEQENEKRLMYLQGQLEALRTAMIKLSNEFKQSKEGVKTTQ